MKAEFIVSGKHFFSEIIKENKKTIWVKAPDGKTIKRHKEKHVIEIKR